MDTARYVEKVATLFGKVVAQMQLDAEVDGYGLTPSQVQGLAYLVHHGRTSVGDLAHGLAMSHPAAVKLIDKLAKKGFVVRLANALDRRVSLVELTESGKSAAEAILSRRTQMLARALSTMDDSQVQDVMRGLETLLAAALEDRRTLDSACLRCGDDHIGCCIVNRAHLEQTGITIDRT